MRSYRLTGGGIDGVKLVEHDALVPGPGQALVKIHAASLNFRDLLLAGKLDSGVVPLSDGAGEVVAVGAGVSRVKVGDRVCGHFYQSWIYGTMQPQDLMAALGGSASGMLAEYQVLPEYGVVKIPDGMSWQQASTLPCAGVTAWHAMREVKAGETVLLLGTGGVSLFGLQLGQAVGARMIATSSSDAKLARMTEMGAFATINYREREDWDVVVRELTGGLGVDHVLEVGGGGTLARSIGAARRGGTIHLIGVLSGGTIDPTPIMLNGLTVRGTQVGSRHMFEELLNIIVTHEIQPVIDRTFGFDEAQDAYRYLASGSHIGKVVIEIP